MLQIFRDPKIDFMGLRRYGYALSAIFVLTSIGLLVWHTVRRGDPLNYGIDFRGGSQFEVRFASPPDVNALRRQLNDRGFSNAAIQSFGGNEDNSILIRVGEHLEENSLLVQQIRRALRPEAEREAEEKGLVDLNTTDERGLATLLESSLSSGDVRSIDPVYLEVAHKVCALRDQQPQGMLSSLEQVRDIAGLTSDMYGVLEKKAFVGSLVFERTESVGPAVGADLRRKALFASVVANGLILLYLSMRFELRFGVAAVVTLVHDLMFVLGVFALTDREFDLTVLAAVLTVIGYSVNDTIVVFDRIRANLKLLRKEPLADVINASINQTLSRTVLTSGSTLLVVLPLYLYGGAVLNGFAFALLVGIVIGTYSSIFVSSPLLLIWERWVSRSS